MALAGRIRNQIFALKILMGHRGRPPMGLKEWPSTSVLMGLLADLQKQLDELEGVDGV